MAEWNSSFSGRIKTTFEGSLKIGIEKTGFPFSPAFAEAASRRQAGMTTKDDYNIYGQTLYSVSRETYQTRNAKLNDLRLEGERFSHTGLLNST